MTIHLETGKADGDDAAGAKAAKADALKVLPPEGQELLQRLENAIERAFDALARMPPQQAGSRKLRGEKGE